MKRLVGRSHRRLFSTKPVPHEALRRDVKYLGRALGDVIKRAPNGPIFATVEEIRHLARHWRRSDDGTDKSADQKLSELVGVVEALDPHRIREVARAFNHFLALSNAAGE
jgi:phosphoenolpyruvate carboxylase